MSGKWARKSTYDVDIATLNVKYFVDVLSTELWKTVLCRNVDRKGDIERRNDYHKVFEAGRGVGKSAPKGNRESKSLNMQTMSLSWSAYSNDVVKNGGGIKMEKKVGEVCPSCNLPHWKCEKCGYTLTEKTPPNVCPECNEKCDFRDVTCYTPDCGGPGNIDPRL